MVGTDFDNLASYVVSRRVALGLEREDLAERMGMVAKTVERIENGTAVRRNTLAALELALGWQPGSARRALDGGQPTLADGTDEPPPETAENAGALTSDEQRLIDALVELEMTSTAIAQELRRYRQRKAAIRSDSQFLQVSDSDTK